MQTPFQNYTWKTFWFKLISCSVCLHLSYHTLQLLFLFENIIGTYNLDVLFQMCVELMCEPVHHSSSMNIFYSTRTPFSPSSISPHRRSSVSSTMWHQNWFHQEHTNTLTWLILTNRASKMRPMCRISEKDKE